MYTYSVPPPGYVSPPYDYTYKPPTSPTLDGHGYYSPRYTVTPPPRPSPKKHTRYTNRTDIPPTYYSYSETTSHRIRAYHPSNSRPRPSTAKTPRKATEDDAARAGIPAGYSIKNWDPTEEPILLLGSVFDADSLGKWIYDWTVFHHGPDTPLSKFSGELWLLLIQLAGKVKRADRCATLSGSNPNEVPVNNAKVSGQREGYQDIADAPYRPNRRRHRHRRGRAFLEGRDEDLDPDYFSRDVIFTGKDGSPSRTYCAKLDTFCELLNPVISHDKLKDMGREADLVTQFKDPNCVGFGNYRIPIMGVVRDMVFRFKGTSVTIRRDVYVTDALDGVADMILNANFVQKYFGLLFTKSKAFFGGWFSAKKETREEKDNAELQRLEAERQAQQNEAARRLREAEKAQEASRVRAGGSGSSSTSSSSGS